MTDTPVLGQPLSPRETQAITHRANGLTIHEIATLLYVAPTTVKGALARAYAKLGARNGCHAIALWYQRRDADRFVAEDTRAARTADAAGTEPEVRHG